MVLGVLSHYLQGGKKEEDKKENRVKEKNMVSREAKDYFECDFADVVVPVLEELDREKQAVVFGVEEDNIATIQAPLSIMNQVFLETERRLGEQGHKRPIPPILL